MSTMQSSTVLIAEDDRFICDLLIEALHEEGYSAECLLDAPSVLARLDGGNVCLMLVDLLMPGQDGLSIIRQVAAEGASVPIVAMSASDLHLAEAVAAGATSTLAKPFELDEVLAVVAQHCDARDAPQIAS